MHDAPFYDRLLESVDQLGPEEYSIRLVEQIELEGSSAGGKSFAYELHDFYDGEGSLKQSTNSGDRYIAIAVDRDYEEFSSPLREHLHVLYTVAADVEAEILLNGDIRRAAGSAYSLSKEDVRKAMPPGFDLARELALRWKDWIICRAVATSCDVHGDVRYASLSKINVSIFGAVDEQQARELHEKLDAAVQPNISRAIAARALVNQHFELGTHPILVKGRWLSKFVHYLIAVALEGQPRESNVGSEILTKTCLETVDFRSAWAAPHRDKIESLLAS